MKKIFLITTIIITFILASCKKDFIEIDPVSTVSVDAVYKTDKDFQDAVTGIYAVFQTEYANFWQYGDVRGDDTKNGLVSNLSVSDMDKFILNNDAPILATTWTNNYNIIYRANNVLSKIETADEAVVKNKLRYIGEARFLRALAYFNLVRIFGAVPKLTEPVKIADSYNTGRASVESIYNEVIIPDLLNAEVNLPLKYTGADLGRATSGAAKSILGKVYLTTHDFTKAEAKLLEVTTMGYSLLPSYKDLFDYTKNEHHSEYIFDIEYEEGINEGSIFTTQFTLSFQGGGTLATEMAKAYGLPLGGGGDQGSPSDSLFILFDQADKRRSISIAKGDTINGVYIPISPTGIGSFTKKYITPMVKANDSRANWKVVRYADVLLMLAEAMNENGKTMEAIEYLNKVRRRAGVAEYSGLSQDETRQKIWLERRFEFYLEGQRWFDLVRTGQALTVMAQYGMKPHMTIFPIPQAQIEIINNPNVFPQNPGYD